MTRHTGAWNMVGPNTKGLRALEAYRHTTYFGGPGQRQCVARSRRTGEKCRAVPMRHKNVCRHHGGRSNGRGVKKPAENRNLRQQNNHAIRHARLEAKWDLDARDLHPETMQVFRQQYAGKIISANMSIFIVALDNRLSGFSDIREWRNTLNKFVNWRKLAVKQT